MKKGIKEELARYLLSIIVMANGGQILVDGREAKELLKGTKLIMVPMVTEPTFLVKLIEDVIDVEAVEVTEEPAA